MARLAAATPWELGRGQKEAPREPLGPTRLLLCGHPHCQAAAAFKAALARESRNFEMELDLAEAPTACQGRCGGGPYVGLAQWGLFFGGFHPREAADLVAETCLAGRLLFPRLLISPRTVTDHRVLYIKDEGVLLLLDQRLCLLKAAAYLFRFNAAESCGKCAPCRLGVPRLATILRRFETGQADEEELAELKALTQMMAEDAYCDFAGKITAPLRLLWQARPEFLQQHLEAGCPQAGSDLVPLGEGGPDAE
ncbi:hypothetical protein AAU61_09660 [Desulfocarbo indianensis]|nr:hypothetical protein AAU61_09660 [Desulfocarbo indianensis]